MKIIISDIDSGKTIETTNIDHKVLYFGVSTFVGIGLY